MDVIVSDMRMPEMDGAALLKTVRERWPDTIRILLTGYSDLEAAAKAINHGGIFRYLNKPWDDEDLRQSLRQALAHKRLKEERDRLQETISRQNAQLKTLNEDLEKKVRQRTAQLQQTMEQLERAHLGLKRSYADAIRVFSGLIGLRTKFLSEHAKRVAEQAHALALKMGMDEVAAQDVLFAALLHDMGKMSLPDHILTKPYAQLCGTERSDYQKHPLLGQALLTALDPLATAAGYIRSHHERYNGSGYPDGLAGEDIPLGARIIAVVSDYEDLLSGHLTGNRHTCEAARSHLSQQKGKHYDPKVVDTFLADWRLRREGGNRRKSSLIVGSFRLKPGMVLAKDITSPDGVLLLAQGLTLDEPIINKIRELERSLDTRFAISIRLNPAHP